MPRSLVVHASNLLARGYLTAADERKSADGSSVNALFAATGAIRRAIDFKEPDVAVAVFEANAPDASFPAGLVSQLERFPELLRAHGVHVVTAKDARHAVASYARAAVDAGHDVVIVGSDKRLAQLVGEKVWWYDPYKDVRYTPELVEKRFEVPPKSVAEWLALVGDDDALPGVKGIGKKGATTLIEAHGTVAEALTKLDDIGGRTGKALRAAKEDAVREIERARLDPHRALPAPLDSLARVAPEASALSALYAELGFFELLEASGGLDAIEVEVCDTPARLEAAMQALDDGPISLYALTEDPTPIRGALVGLALSKGAARFYVPFGEGAEVPAPLAALLEGEARPKIGHDLKESVVALARRGVTIRGVSADSACASHLREPSNMAPHDLPLVARHVLKRALIDEDAVRGVGRARKRWRQLPTLRAARYAAQMAGAAEEICAALATTTDQTLHAEYLALSETLVRMELRGIAVDAEDLERAGGDFDRIREGLESEIHTLAEKEFNIGSTKQLGAVLYEQLKLPIVKRTKTGWSTATEALERIEGAHPIVPLVIRYRTLRRLRDTWVTALLKSIDDDGRVRSMFHPARSFSGRLVNSNPDLGRVPGKTPEMARIRHAFHTAPDTVLLSVDFEQLGLFVLAHLTRDPALVVPLRDRLDLHTLTAAAVLDIDAAKIGRDERQIGKVVNFATFAGQGASALGLSLGLSASEAKKIIARFDQRYAVVRAFQDEQLRLAKTRGYIETIAGRHWPIGGLSSPDQQLRSYAERLARRATHEGSVADVSRRSLLRADQALREAGLRTAPLLQVHDEVLFEVPESELPRAAQVITEAMRTAFDLEVPLRVGAKVGANWAELKSFRGRKVD